MESSVDPPVQVFVAPPSNQDSNDRNELTEARDTLSLPNLTENNVTVIHDHILTSDEPSTSTAVTSPRPLTALAAEATISVMRAYQSIENMRVSPREPFYNAEYSLADILLDRPCHRQQKSSGKKPHRTLSSPELIIFHHAGTSASQALPHNRLKSQRPGFPSQGVQFTSTEQQMHLDPGSILPPLEPSRRSRFLITYNYTQNRFRILRFEMEMRHNQVGMQRFLRNPFFPRALLNQIQGIGVNYVPRQRGVLQRATQTNNIPRALVQQQQQIQSSFRPIRPERGSSSQPPRSPVASTSRYEMGHPRLPRPSLAVDNLNDLVTYSSMPSLRSSSQQQSPIQSASLITHQNSDSSTSSIELNDSPPLSPFLQSPPNTTMNSTPSRSRPHTPPYEL